MNIGKICNKNVTVCHRDTTALQLAQLMRKHHVGDCLVVDSISGITLPVGIVTDRDLVVSVIAPEIDAATICVEDIMSSPLTTAYESEDIFSVLERMRQHGIRRIPIIDETGCLFGIVALDDIVAALAGMLVQMALVSGQGKSLEEQHKH